MFAAGVAIDRMFSHNAAAMRLVHGYNVFSIASFRKFDMRDGWHRPSAFPVNVFYIYPWPWDNNSDMFFDAYCVFNKWFGYGYWEVDTNSHFRRRKYNKWWPAISSSSNWMVRRGKHCWALQIAEIEQFIENMVGVLTGGFSNGRIRK